MNRIIFLILIFSSFSIKAQFNTEQNEVKDSAFAIPIINVSYAYQWSGAEMKDRFGANYNVGGSFLVKTKKHWVYGLKGNFLWGADVNDDKVLKNITTDEGYAIDDQGQLTDIFLDQRGSSFFLIGGKMINKFAPNKNSGFLFYGGIGMLQHKISIKFDANILFLSNEHKKGYDRFSLGYAANGFAGYLYLSKNRLLNFFGGFDYTIGWTKSLRKFNYDEQKPDTKTYKNTLYGFRLGWIIRLNRRQSQEYYYY